MKKVFFDTWGWVAIAHKNDSHHSEVVSFYNKFLINNGIPVTSDYILSEAVTLLRAKTDTKGVMLFIDTILSGVKSEKILLERIDEQRWNKAWDMCKKYYDKPYISFFDFTSFIVMKELSISDVLTSDRHFEEVGMGFKRLF